VCLLILRYHSCETFAFDKLTLTQLALKRMEAKLLVRDAENDTERMKFEQVADVCKRTIQEFISESHWTALCRNYIRTHLWQTIGYMVHTLDNMIFILFLQRSVYSA